MRSFLEHDITDIMKARNAYVALFKSIYGKDYTPSIHRISSVDSAGSMGISLKLEFTDNNTEVKYNPLATVPTKTKIEILNALTDTLVEGFEREFNLAVSKTLKKIAQQIKKEEALIKACEKSFKEHEKLQ